MKKNNDIRSVTYFVEDVVFFKHLVHFVSFLSQKIWSQRLPGIKKDTRPPITGLLEKIFFYRI